MPRVRWLTEQDEQHETPEMADATKEYGRRYPATEDEQVDDTEGYGYKMP